MGIFNDKIILLTGGTGSFGRKFVEIVLKEHQPKIIRIFSRDELKQSEMAKVFNDPRLRFLVGDVRDKNRLQRAVDGVDIVIHAAALKQVPSCEYNPFEAVQTNIMGAQNIVDVAIDNNVEKVVFLSSDKAANPANLYGATKLCAEKICVQGNSYVGTRKTKISVIRYGNVAASRGSVIPLFLEQKKQGQLTITDERMTRFWVTQKETVNFVAKIMEKMQGGEIFVPKLPSVKILDLAKAIAPEAKIIKVGIRPGEKLHEVLLTSDEARHSLELDDYFVIEPDFQFWKKEQEEGVPVAEDFQYASNTNHLWLSVEYLREILKNL